jgi:hypothetical protein
MAASPPRLPIWQHRWFGTEIAYSKSRTKKQSKKLYGRPIDETIVYDRIRVSSIIPVTKETIMTRVQTPQEKTDIIVKNLVNFVVCVAQDGMLGVHLQALAIRQMEQTAIRLINEAHKSPPITPSVN